MSAIHWTESHTARSARWHSESSTPPPTRVLVVDDRTRADSAYRLACEGTALLWRGDFHNARQLLRAMSRRLDRKQTGAGETPAECFRLHRQARAHRARVLGRLLVVLEDDFSLHLPRAPEVRSACRAGYGPPVGAMIISLTELLGVISAHQWRLRGIWVPALDHRIHPHYGVFAPTRSEYVDLVARAPLELGAGRRTAFDLGTGTGVLAAVLARRGFDDLVATDINPRALDCARENVRRLRLAAKIKIVGPALFPEGRARLIVCNPPWIPARPTSALEQGVYDRDGRMLHEFLTGLTAHLEPDGEGWLILSDLAERLGLRTRDELLSAVEATGLRILDRIDARPRHPRSRATVDNSSGTLLQAARAAEITSLWRLGH